MACELAWWSVVGEAMGWQRNGAGTKLRLVVKVCEAGRQVAEAGV